MSDIPHQIEIEKHAARGNIGFSIIKFKVLGFLYYKLKLRDDIITTL